MPETIRDVVIRIRMKQDGPTKLAAPDTTAWTKEMNRVTLALATAKQSSVSAHQSALNDSLSDSFGIRNGQAHVAASGKPAAAAMDELLKSETASIGVTKQRAEAYTAMGESILRAGRGVAFLTAMDEENLRASLALVAASQGFIDAFAGVTGVVKAGLTLRQASIATTLAQATATGASTAATGVNTAVDAASISVKIAKVGVTRAETAALAYQTAAMTTATAAQTGFNVAALANPITAAVISAIGLGAAAWYIYSKSTREAAEGEKKLNDAINDRITTGISARQQFATLQTAVEQLRIGTAIELAGVTSDIAMKRQELDRAQDAAVRIRNLAPPGVAIDTGTRMEQLQQNAAFEKEMLNVSKARMELARDLVQQKQREGDLAQQALSTARQTVAVEIESRRSAQEKFGRLSSGEQEQLKGIAKDLQDGKQLTEQQARRLEGLGFTSDLTKQFYEQRGGAAGFDSFAEGTGINQRLMWAKENLRATFSTAGQALEDAFEEGRDAVAEFKATVTAVKGFAEMLRDTNIELKRVQADVDKMKGKQVQRDLHNDWGTGKF